MATNKFDNLKIDGLTSFFTAGFAATSGTISGLTSNQLNIASVAGGGIGIAADKALVLTSGDVSSWTVSGGKTLTLAATDVGGEIDVTSSGAVNITTNANSKILASTGNFTVDVAVGDLTLQTDAGDFTLSIANNASMSSKQMSLNSTDVSAWTVTGNTLTLETATSGSIDVSSHDILYLQSGSATEITSVGTSFWHNTSGGLELKTLTSGDVDVTSAGATVVTSNDDSSWTVNSHNLSLTANSGGEILVTSAGITTISSHGASSWTNATGDLDLLTTGSGAVNIHPTGAFGVIAGANSSVAITGTLGVASTGASSWANDTGDLALSTTTSGAVNITSIGASTIDAKGGDLTLETTTGSGGNVVVGSNAAVNVTAATALGVIAGANSTVAITGTLGMTSTGASSWANDTGDLALSTTTSGAVNITSIGASTIDAKGGDLTLETTTGSGGNVVVGSNAAVNVTAATAFSVTAGSATVAVTGGDVTVSTDKSIILSSSDVTIGASGGKTNIVGDLNVEGTMTVVNSSTIDVGNNQIVLNSAPYGSSVDSGMLIQRSGEDIVANVPVFTSHTADATVNAVAPAFNVMSLASGDTANTAVGSWVQLTSGPLINEIGQVTAITTGANGHATINSHNYVSPLTGVSFTVSGGGISLLGDGTTLFLTELTVGNVISVTDDVHTYTYTVVGIADNQHATLSGGTDINGLNANVVGNGWGSVALVGGGTYTIGATSITASSGTPFSVLSPGETVSAVVSGVTKLFQVVSITNNQNIVITSQGVTGTSTSMAVESPGYTATYKTYNEVYAGVVFNSTTKTFNFEASLDPSNGTVLSAPTLIDIAANQATLNSLALTGVTAAILTGGGTWSAGTYTPGTFADYAFELSGGFATSSNILMQSSSVSGPLLDIRQDNTTTAEPVMALTQVKIDAPFFSFSGLSNNTALGASIVPISPNVTGAEALGYAMVNVVDNSVTNPLSSGIYYIPLYKLDVV